MSQKPTLGRIVHYVTRDGTPQAAMIVNVWSDVTVNLVVFRDGINDDHHDSEGSAPQVWKTSVTQNEENHQAAYTWHWPPRV